MDSLIWKRRCVCLKTFFKMTDHCLICFFSFVSLVFELRDNRTKLIYTMLLSVSCPCGSVICKLCLTGTLNNKGKRRNHPNHRNTGIVCFLILCWKWFAIVPATGLGLKCKSAADSGHVVSMLKRGITTGAAVFQVRLMSFLDSHNANKKQAHKRNRWAERSSDTSSHYLFPPLLRPDSDISYVH